MEKQEATTAAAAKAAWIEAEKALNKQQPISGDVNFHLKVLAILPKAKKSKTNLLFLTICMHVSTEMCVQLFKAESHSLRVFPSLSIFLSGFFDSLYFMSTCLPSSSCSFHLFFAKWDKPDAYCTMSCFSFGVFLVFYRWYKFGPEQWASSWTLAPKCT